MRRVFYFRKLAWKRPEFAAKALRQWLASLGVQAANIEPGSPWENGYCESFNG